MDEQEMEERFKQLFERARKGVLQYLNDKGGTMSLGEMHDYSLNKYFIQHRRFSKLMETLVEENLIIYDENSQDSTITDKGKAFIQ